MSLKAKIEAVIYASEEPVTLAQLTGLLGEEGQAELDALAAQQHSLALEDEESDDDAIEPVEDADALNAETTDRTESDEESAATEPGAPRLASGTWMLRNPSPTLRTTESETAEPADSRQKASPRCCRREEARRTQAPRLLPLSPRRAHRRLRQRQPRPRDPRSRRRLPPRHQARVSRRRPRLRQVPQAAAKAHPAGARNPRRRRLQAARHRARGLRDPWRRLRRRPRLAAHPQARHHRRPQAGHRPPHPLQNHQGLPPPLRPQGHQRAPQHRRVREDGRRAQRAVQEEIPMEAHAAQPSAAQRRSQRRSHRARRPQPPALGI